jgi:hypothetical protein
MSGGVAYVYDEDGQFAKRCNTAMVTLDKVLSTGRAGSQMERGLASWPVRRSCSSRKLLEDHNRWTGSKRARELLDNWEQSRAKFVKVFPIEYKRALGEYAKKMEASVWPPPKRCCKQGRRSPPSKAAQRITKDTIMGKVTGFMEYERIEEGYKPVAERLKHYKEFVIGLDDAQAKVQGARCMDCGTPFCNNGCPVNNIIPDFNDLVYRATGRTRSRCCTAPTTSPSSPAASAPHPARPPAR